MKKFRTTKNFDKQYIKLSPKLKTKFQERLQIFLVEPSDPILRDHALKGKYARFRSIDVTGDLRALYYEQGKTIVVFAFIGSHSQLYG